MVWYRYSNRYILNKLIKQLLRIPGDPITLTAQAIDSIYDSSLS